MNFENHRDSIRMIDMKSSNRHSQIIALGLLSSLWLAAAPLSAQTNETDATLAADKAKPIALTEIQPAVQKLIGARIGDGTLGDIERTDEKGEPAYVISFITKTGENQDFTVSEDGTLLSLGMPLAELPDAVQNTIRAQAKNGGEVTGIDKNVADTQVSFDVEVAKDGREKYFTVANDGLLSSKEVELAETPPAVQATIKTYLADGNLQSIDENLDPAEKSFDIEAVAMNGIHKSFSVAADGRLLSEQVVLQKTPAVVRQTIQEKIGIGKLLRIDKTFTETKAGTTRVLFEVQCRMNGRPINFSVGQHGRFLGLDN